MKKILLTLVLLIGIVVGLFAQKLTYQAVVRDNNQQLVVNTAVKATVTIAFTTGDPYAAEVNGNTNIHGLLSIEFGDETLYGRDWTGATIAVKVVDAATTSTVYVNDDPRPVSAVPYALSVDGQSIQNYLTEHNYVDLAKLNDTLSKYPTTAAMDSRHYLTSDSTVITTMQDGIATNATNIATNAADIANLTQHTTKSAIRDSVAGQIHDSIADIAAKSHTHGNKDLLDTYNQTNADLADAVAKKHAHDNAAVLAATTAPYTDADSIKLKGIAEGAEVNVQADWTQNTTTADDYIKNKPTIPTVPTNVSAFSNDAGYITATDVPAQVNADWNATSGTAQILNKPELFSGNYNDLSNKPTIPTVPTNVSAFSNDAGYITATDVPAQVNADWNATSGTAQILNKPELFSGNYNDLSNKPTIPTVPTNVSAFSNDAGYITATDVPAQVNADWNATNGTAQILNKPELFSGNYNDLSNKPTIPAAANNATLTIQKNGTSVGTFTADASSDKSINITVPTTTSELTNNSGFITTANVPTNVSQLNNDAGYLTNADLTTLLSAINGKIDSLAHLVDSLSNLTPGGEPTATFTCGSSKVKDVDNNEYNTVKIGSQCWMAQNLRTSTNAAGAGNIYTPTASEVPGYDVNTYGRLYDWAAVMQGASPSDAVPSGVQGICPTGWHVPSDAEWTQLTTYVKSKSEYQCDGADNIANALSAAIGWSYNTSEGCYAGSISSTINLTGFSAVPAGLYNVRSLDFSHSAFFWSTTEYDSNNAYYRNLSSNDAEVSRWDFSKDNGHSVRCLRDASIGGGDNPSEPAMMSCEQVMECMGDTLGQLNAKIEAQGAEIETLNGTVTSQGQTIETLNSTVESQGNTIDSLAHLVDSLSNLPHGGGGTPTVADGQPCPGTATVSDVDGNTYNTVKIGNQCWMKENLRTTTKRNNVGNVYTENTTAGYNAETYGYYYDWEAVMQNESGDKVQGICPTGWHVPTWAEYLQLTDYVNSQPIFCCYGESGKISKALASSEGWASVDRPDSECCIGNAPARNNWTRFSLMPAGYYLSGYRESGMEATIWSATDLGSMVHVLRLFYASDEIGEILCLREMGCSVRCLRDASIGGGDNPSAPTTMSCEQVMECMGDTLGKLNTKIEAQGAEIETLNGTVTTQGNTIDSLAHVVDSLAKLVPGGDTVKFTCGTSKVKDVDNNEYSTVKIGDQCWMKENLRTTKKPNGENITEGMWEPGTNSVETYGRLYSWTTVMNEATSSEANPSGVQGICPTGWHVPSDAEWIQMEMAVGMSESDANNTGYRGNIAAKLCGNTGWTSSSTANAAGNTSAPNRNSSGFSVLPAGFYSGIYSSFGYSAYFWSATEGGSDFAYYRYLAYNSAGVYRDYNRRTAGFSVRCVRD